LEFLRAGSIDLADRTLDLVMDKTQMASCLVGYSQVFWQKNEPGEALETLEEAYAILKSQRDAETRDSRARFALFATIAVQFAHFEKPDRAIEIAQQNIDENEQTSALAQIADVCTLQNKDEFARQAVQAIADDAQKMFALISVSDAKNRAGKREEAIEILREAASLAETVPQLAPRSAAFNEFARRFLKYGETEKAREILRENLETISQIRDESVRASTLAGLAEIYEQESFALTDTEKEILLTMIRRAER
jgi:tetratricopeptide (TPR) repeat protein